MKLKNKLLFSLVFYGLLGYAQQPVNALFPVLHSKAHVHPEVLAEKKSPASANQSFWLNYGWTEDSLKGGISILNSAYLFPDSSVFVNYGSGSYNRPWIHCISDVTDVLNADFHTINKVNFNKFTNFSVDSMSLLYLYERHSAATVVDTLVVSLYSNAVSSNLKTGLWTGATGWNSNFNVDTLSIKLQKYNPATNGPKAIGMQVFKIPLTKSDTASAFYALKKWKTNQFSIPAGKLICSAISFVPGYVYHAGDTLDKKAGNSFTFASYEENGASTLPSYVKGQWNNSGIITNGVRFNIDHLGWDSTFIPDYLYTAPYGLEHHQISYKVTSINAGIAESLKPGNGMRLYQNYPNPVTGGTSIVYELAFPAEISLELVDISGRVVMNRKEGFQKSGSHVMELDLNGFSKGIYFYTLRMAGGNSLTRRLILAD